MLCENVLSQEKKYFFLIGTIKLSCAWPNMLLPAGDTLMTSMLQLVRFTILAFSLFEFLTKILFERGI